MLDADSRSCLEVAARCPLVEPGGDRSGAQPLANAAVGETPAGGWLCARGRVSWATSTAYDQVDTGLAWQHRSRARALRDHTILAELAQ